MSKGCKPVPPELIGGKVLWAHPDGYFLNALGNKLEHNFSPAKQRGFTADHPSSGGFTGSIYPTMANFGSKSSHSLMAIAFYGPRPIFFGKNGKPYAGICHHLIPDKLDYKPANLLCWLTREQHAEADRRQRALIKVVPDGDLTAFTYERLRDLQDPRSMSRELFEQELAAIQSRHFRREDPHAVMLYDMTHRCEE